MKALLPPVLALLLIGLAGYIWRWVQLEERGLGAVGAVVVALGCLLLGVAILLLWTRDRWR